MRLLVLATLVAALPAGANAEPMRFNDALARAAAEAPVLGAGSLFLEAQRSKAVAAAQLPDPKVSVGIDNFPISGPPVFTFSGDNMTMARIGLSQEVPNLGKRHARTVRANADIGEAQASLAVSQRQLLVAAGTAWIDLAFADRRLAAIDQAIADVSHYRDSAAASTASGSARPAQALEVRQAIAALEDQRAELAAEQVKAKSTLARWTGDPDPQVSGPLPEFTVDPARLNEAIVIHPELALAAARVKQAEADITLARADKRPDWMFDVAYQRRAERFGDMVSAGVTVSLPLFTRKRQDPLIASRTAASGAALAEQENLRRMLAAELEAGLAEHDMHHDQLRRARTTLLPLARQRVDLETASYVAGRASLIDVITARTALAETELLVLEREAGVARDAGRLVLTYGAPEQ